MGSITLDLDESLEQSLDEYCRETGRERDEVVRDMVRRQLALSSFRKARRALIPYAEAAGYFTDEDVFRDVS